MLGFAILVMHAAKPMSMAGCFGTHTVWIFAKPGVAMHVSEETLLAMRATAKMTLDRFGAVPAINVAVFRICWVYKSVHQQTTLNSSSTYN
ncbi:hypothetical protein D3C85_1698600 [compost metagenome]